MTGQLILVRHAAVSERYHGRCYGRSDVELSVEGVNRSGELCSLLAAQPITHVFHSGLQRTRYLAEILADVVHCDAECCTELQERDFGEWELESWDHLYQRHGQEILKMITDPVNYRPGGGETTFEMRDRVMAWFQARMPIDGVAVAVSHGGPIAAFLGTQRRLAVAEWVSLIPACGQVCSLDVHRDSGPNAARRGEFV